jgi:Protein of unknown function (DUF2934)
MESTQRQPKSTKRVKKELSTVDNESKAELNKEDRNLRIAVAAYYKAEARGFEPGHELGDWLAAEAEENQ